MNRKKRLPMVCACAFLLLLAGLTAATGLADGPSETEKPGARWTAGRAREWYAKQPWLVGCNFNPSTAINELEMWQAETFDLPTIDRELGWAEDLGFSSIRVFLHHIPWQQDHDGFLKRIDSFLEVADKHHIGVMFVLFDSCWDPFPKAGRQRDPKPHLHNSGWVQCPGQEILKDPSRHDELESYVTGVIGKFKNDRRVQVWDLFNEPDNLNQSSYGKQEFPEKPQRALELIRKAFTWARSAQPSQPLTAGVWIGNWGDPAKLSAMERFCLEHSDVISFHSYAPVHEARKCVESLQRYRRPILCTEYMARPTKSTFESVLPYFKEQHVAAYNWGFVDGKTQTIYPWDSWQKKYTDEPPLWFHDIFRGDGTPYDPKEVAVIRRLTKPASK